MKPKEFSKLVTILAAFLMALPFTATSAQEEKAGDSRGITVVTTPSLQGLAASLSSGYSKASGIESRVKTADNIEKACNPSAGEIALIPGSLHGTPLPGDALSTVIGRDVTVGIINSDNPVISELNKKGLSPAAISKITNQDGRASWGSLTGTGDSSPVRFYSRNNDLAAAAIAAFSGSAASAGGIAAADDSEAISFVRSDRNGIAFVSLSSLADGKTNALPAGTAILPVDRNGNGTIDFQEAIYSDLNSFTRGVWIGKYPPSLVSSICAVIPASGVTGAAADFARWIVTEGQDIISEVGHTALIAGERVTAADRIAEASVRPVAVAATTRVFGPLFILLAAICAIAALIYVASSYFRKRKFAEQVHLEPSLSALNPSGISVPAGIYFDKAHTWAFMDQEGTVTTGVDDFLQHVTGRITRVKMMEPGKKVKRGERFLSLIQNGKQIDLYAPVSGTITGVNEALIHDSSAINASPYKAGWIYKISPSNWLRENPLLFMAEKQVLHLNREMGRLRDFLAKATGGDAESSSQLVLQDGGEIRDGVLSSLGPEVWEDFQSDFIDSSKQVWFHEIL
ncbi:MAG: hypothetical protein MUD02_07005 [Bacteroidales bacterium]|nr:hypothetical protein [Bacteroidales bacterium]